MTTLANLRTLCRKRANQEVSGGSEDLKFVDNDELDGYLNDGIKEAEAELHKICPWMFMTQEFLSLTLGSNEVALPSDIYATKIRAIYCLDNGVWYEVKQIRAMEDVRRALTRDASERYIYLFENDATDGARLLFYPAAQVTTAVRAKIYYLREAQQLSDVDDEPDIPEFEAFIIWHCVRLMLEKDGDPKALDVAKTEARQRFLMVENLSELTADENADLAPDLGHYIDHISDYDTD